MSAKKLRVAVIGAGASGLCAARHLLLRQDIFFPPVVYERTNHVAGIWVYDERFGQDENGLPVHSSIYRDLRTNLPKEIMAFPDYPFDPLLPSFMHHTVVRQYLEEYCNSSGITEHIRFNTLVEDVRPIITEASSSGTTWQVSSIKGKQTFTDCFEAVFVCNGHYSVPHIPEIPGLENFTGRIMHSHDYRTPEPFTGQSVVLLGVGPSGLDIALDLSTVTAHVTISHNNSPLSCPLPKGVYQVPGVRSVNKQGELVFKDGTRTKPDIFMFCTGYKYTFPFLSQEVAVDVHENYITPLYKHLVHTAFPSLFFVGLCQMICPFPFFHCQVLFALAVLNGSCKLPTRDQMDQETAQETLSRLQSGILQRHLMRVRYEQWHYTDKLAQMGGFPPLPGFTKRLFEEVNRCRRADPNIYKTQNYEIVNEHEWKHKKKT